MNVHIRVDHHVPLESIALLVAHAFGRSGYTETDKALRTRDDVITFVRRKLTIGGELIFDIESPDDKSLDRARAHMMKLFPEYRVSRETPKAKP